MKIVELKKKLKATAIKCAIIVAVVSVVFGIVDYLESYFEEKNQEIVSQKDSLQGLITQKTTLYDTAKKDYEDFKILNKNKQPTETGLAAAHERISEAIPAFDKLKKLYKFTKLDFTISATTPSTKVTSPLFDVFEGQVNIDYTGVSDEFIFSFLNDLKYELSGFIELKNIDIAGSTSTSNDAIPGLVSGKIQIIWYTLKSKQTSGTKPAQ
jgi:hypothetical protein